MELEALEAILMDDLRDFEGTRPEGWDPACKCYSIIISPTDDGVSPAAADDLALQAEIVFAHTANYPDEAPHLRARSITGLSDADVTQLQRVVDEQVQENLGMAMIYAVVAAAQEWLRDKVAAGTEPEIDPVAAKKAAEEADERRLAEIRSLGTPVTPEHFVTWKKRFYAEIALARSRAQADQAASKKLTGKQYFLQNDTRAGAEDGEGTLEGSGGEEEDDDEDDVDYDDDDDDEDFLDELEGEPAKLLATT